MAKAAEVLRDGVVVRRMIFCPGCKYGHMFDNRWHFTGDLEKPTFDASMLVNQHDPLTRCHSYVRNGMIEFLSDCAHSLKGQTVPLEDFEWDK